jgi:DNA-binding response OmpR family regulator
MSHKRILVVDDSIPDRLFSSRLLATAGYEVEEAGDGAAAWDLMQDSEFDAVIADWEMPVVDGLELVRRARNSTRFSRLPMILNTGRDDDHDRDTGLALGADEFITKGRGDTRALLLDALARLIEHREEEQGRERAFATAVVIDRSGVSRQLLARYLHGHCDHVEELRTVAELRERLRGSRVSLVVIEATDEAMTWFEEIAKREEKPAVLVVTWCPSQEDELRAGLLGAVGYLAKPVPYRRFASALSLPDDAEPRPGERREKN